MLSILKQQNTISIALVSIIFIVSAIFFSIYTMMYVSILKENMQLGKNTKPSQKIAQVNSTSSNNVLGEEDAIKKNEESAQELRQIASSKRAYLTPTPQITYPLSFGVALNDYANKTGELSKLQEDLKGKIETVSIYKHFAPQGKNTLSQDELSYMKSKGLKLLIAWEPWNSEQGMAQSVDFLKEIPLGIHDDYIRSFAASVKEFQNPVTIRFAHEMNGNWYPWGGRPAEFINAYRHIVSIFRSENVTNVQWMWCVNAESVPVTPIENIKSFYPGDDVVDVIGIDGLNFGVTQAGNRWKTFTEIFQQSYQYLNNNYSQPIFVAETSSTEVGGDKAFWIKDMFTVLPKTFSGIKEVIWFDIEKETDWRIDSSSTSLESFKKYLDPVRK